MYACVKWRGKHVTQSSELHAPHAFMQHKRVVMKFDKLLSVIVRRIEKHVYFKLTNNRQTDTCLLTNNRHSVPMMYICREHRLWTIIGLYGQTNKLEFAGEWLIGVGWVMSSLL